PGARCYALPLESLGSSALTEMVPEPVRPRVQAALAAPAGDHLVDLAGVHGPAVADAQPQLRPPCLRVPGAGTDVAVQGAGGVVPDRAWCQVRKHEPVPPPDHRGDYPALTPPPGTGRSHHNRGTASPCSYKIT